MPWENIGSVDTGEMPHEEEWISFCLGMAKSYIDFVCREIPEDGKLEIIWHDHELGNYPSLGVRYELDEPCRYIHACEEALDAFNGAVSWFDLKKHFKMRKEGEMDEDEDDDKEDDSNKEY